MTILPDSWKPLYKNVKKVQKSEKNKKDKRKHSQYQEDLNKDAESEAKDQLFI